MKTGVLLVKKDSGGTSHSLVSAVRKIMGLREVGHAGTLDPIADGLMVILLGRATKLSDYLLTGDKQYCFVLRLGAATDTLDRTGKVLETKPVNCTQKQIEEVLKQHQGALKLPVPFFSAVKVRGKKLYEYMRQGQKVEAPAREMFFYDLKIKRIEIEDKSVEVQLSCRKGAYVRSWVSAVGEALGTGAYLESLTRLRSEPFSLESALSLEEIKNRLNPSPQPDTAGPSMLLEQALKPAFISFAKALPHIQPVIVSQNSADLIKHGRVPVQILLDLKDAQKQVNQTGREKTIRIMSYQEKQLLALLSLRVFKEPKILRVFTPPRTP